MYLTFAILQLHEIHYCSISNTRKSKITYMGCCLPQSISLAIIKNAIQKHLGCKKSARPIRSNMQAGRCDQKL